MDLPTFGYHRHPLASGSVEAQLTDAEPLAHADKDSRESVAMLAKLAQLHRKG